MDIVEMIKNGLAPLSVAILCNIGVGMYYKIGVEHIKFDWKHLFSGILKAAIIGGSFCGLSYCSSVTGLGGDLASPQDIITAAILLYMAKTTENLIAIFGVKLTKKTT